MALGIALWALAILTIVWWGEWPSLRGSPMVAIPLRFVEVHPRQRPWLLDEVAPPAEERTAFASLYGSNVVRQDLRCPAANLSRIALWMAGPAGEEVTLTLHDRASGERYVAQHTIADPGAGYTDFRFPALAGSRGASYTLEVSAPGATWERAVVLRIAPGDRLGGPVTLNRYLVSGNLDLVAYHRGPPGRWWLDVAGEWLVPLAFRQRLVQYKPNWVKGVTVGRLALAGLGLSLLALMAGLWRNKAAWLILALLTLALLGGCAASARMRVGRGPQVEMIPLDAQRVQPASGRHVVYDLLMNLDAAAWDLTRARHRGQARAELATGAPAPRPGLAMAGQYELAWRVMVPPGAYLRTEYIPAEEEGLFEVRVSAAGMDEMRIRQRAGGAEGARGPVDVDLGAYAGRWARIELRCPDGAGTWVSPQVWTRGEWLRAYPLPPSERERLRGAEGARFGDRTAPDRGIELLGYTVDGAAFKPGDEVPIELYWHARQGIERDYTVFVHLFDERDAFVTSYDTRPVLGAFPTTLWAPDHVVLDARTLPLPADLPPGTYSLRVGLYELETLARLPAYAGGLGIQPPGERLTDDARRLDIEIAVENNP